MPTTNLRGAITSTPEEEMVIHKYLKCALFLLAASSCVTTSFVPQNSERAFRSRSALVRRHVLEEKVSTKSPTVEKVSVKKLKSTFTNRGILSKGLVKETLKAKKPKSEGGRGSGGRGRSRGYGGRTPVNTVIKKKMFADYYYYIGSSKQASDFEITTEFMINHIKNTFEYGHDIRTVLKMLDPMDKLKSKPKLAVSKASDPSDKVQEQKQFDMEFNADYEEFRKRIRTYNNNLTKSYVLIWERCTKAMQNKIQLRMDLDTIENDPIELLKAVKEHSLNYQEHRYEMSIILDSIKNMLETHKKEHENLSDYTKRFKTSRDVLELHIGGPIILTKYVHQ
eukprot:scaffold44262_cov52-Attheya_sp.AAC.7